jgi:hypothetical protein
MKNFDFARDIFAGIGFAVCYLLACGLIGKIIYLIVRA